MAPSQTSTASDAIVPDSPIAEATGATMDARTDLDAHDIDTGLDTAEDMVDVFVDRPAPSNQSAQKASDDLADPRRDSVEENAVQLYTDDPTANANSSEDAAEGTELAEASNTPVEASRLLPGPSHQQQAGSGTKENAGETEGQAPADQADQANTTAASAAALAAAAVTSAVATPTVPTLQIPSGLPPGGGAYPPFTPLAPNGTPMMPQSLVSVPMNVGRRAVRIAPMGVLPLPPQSGAASLVPELANSTAAGLATAAASTEVANVESQLNAPSGSVGTTIGDMPKGKRRGVPGGGPISTEGMTPEERTKQKRMLRNRESAARSRDKRKTKNIQLEASIDKHKNRKLALEQAIHELQGVVDSMQQVLRKHKISLSC